MTAPISHNEPSIAEDRELLQMVMVVEEGLDPDERSLLLAGVECIEDGKALTADLRLALASVWKEHSLD